MQEGSEVRWYIENQTLSHLLKNEEQSLDSIRSVMEFNPDAIFVPGNWVPFFFPGLKVQVFHGFGIEKKGHFRIRNFFDLYCTHGPITTGKFKQLAEQYPHFRVIETGWPKVDPLFSSSLQASPGQKSILYAPTFSPSLTSITALHKVIRSLIERYDWHWTIKYHPKTGGDLRGLLEGINNQRVSIKDEEDILPLMQQSDIMISDTSSVITEFMLLDKPIIAFNNAAPAGHLKNITDASQLESVLVELTSKRPDWLIRQQNYIEQMHPYHDGKSSQRVLSATRQTIDNQKTHRLRKPFNLFRNIKVVAKLRKQIFDYYFS